MHHSHADVVHTLFKKGVVYLVVKEHQECLPLDMFQPVISLKKSAADGASCLRTAGKTLRCVL